MTRADLDTFIPPRVRGLLADPAFIGSAVRLASEQELRRKRLRDYCALVSTAFSVTLAAFAVEHGVMVGEFRGKSHVWVEAAGTIYDLTLTQFDRHASPVAISGADDPRYRLHHRSSKEVARFDLELMGVAYAVPKIVQRAAGIMAYQLVASRQTGGSDV